MTSGISADALMQPPGGPLDTWPAQAMLSLRRCAAKEEQPRHSTLRGAPVTCSAAQRQSRACTHAWGRFGPREYSDCSLLPVVHDKPPFHGHTSITPGPKPNAVATTRRAPQEFHGCGSVHTQHLGALQSEAFHAPTNWHFAALDRPYATIIVSGPGAGCQQQQRPLEQLISCHSAGPPWHAYVRCTSKNPGLLQLLALPGPACPCWLGSHSGHASCCTITSPV